MKKDLKEISSMITMGIVPKILEKLNEVEEKYQDKIESWDFNEKDLTVTGKLKDSGETFEERIEL